MLGCKGVLHTEFSWKQFSMWVQCLTEQRNFFRYMMSTVFTVLDYKQQPISFFQSFFLLQADNPKTIPSRWEYFRIFVIVDEKIPQQCFFFLTWLFRLSQNSLLLVYIFVHDSTSPWLICWWKKISIKKWWMCHKHPFNLRTAHNLLPKGGGSGRLVGGFWLCHHKTYLIHP